MKISPNIVVISPVMHSEPRFWKSVINMFAYSWHKGIKVQEIGITERTVVDWARNNLGRSALEKNCEYTDGKYSHFLWLDSDHVFNPDLLEVLLSHDKDMVSALYFGRMEPYFPVVYVRDHNNHIDKYKHYPLTDVPNTLFECDAVGFGALLMRREVLECIPEPWFTVDYRAGEDIAFCVKVKEHDFKIYCDGRYKLGHIGSTPIITEKTYVDYMAEHGQKYEDKIKVELNGR